ncbi:MAG: phosphate-starvation-inducible PsiE family protein [Pseudomonadota bacterium]
MAPKTATAASPPETDIRRGKETSAHVAARAPSMDGDDPWLQMADRFYLALVRSLTGLAIVALCAWMGAGVIVLALDLGQVLASGWASVAERAIIDSLIMLALLEVIRTLQSYLKLGRVRVTFILDTALVVLIGELMGLWFREYAPQKVVLGLGVIVALVALRIVTVRFSPEAAGEVR